MFVNHRLLMMIAGWLGAWCLVLAVNAEQPRVAFATSVTGTGDLSTWADANEQTGLAAGDAICQALADAGNLANPEGFVAWLSDEDDDAFCRVHGLTGKRSDNCGLSELPPPVGPWVRTDGFPFAQTIDRLLHPSYEILSALRFDELGSEIVSGTITIQTGTDAVTGGEDAPGSFSGHCNNWTDGTSAFGVTLGFTDRTHRPWSSGGGSSSCAGFRRIACLEASPGPELPVLDSPGRTVFVTTTSGRGDLASWSLADEGLTGIAAGDSICRNEAHAAGLDDPDSFRAWLSDDSVDAIDRFENEGPWVRLDGARIAASKAELTSGSLFVPNNVSAAGEYEWRTVHTGTNADGSSSGSDCINWTSSDSEVLGNTGTTNLQLSGWTGTGDRPCNGLRNLYCFSDPEFGEDIFSDRFETLLD